MATPTTHPDTTGPAPAQPALHARSVSVGYEGRTVCQSIDLEIEPGSVTRVST